MPFVRLYALTLFLRAALAETIMQGWASSTVDAHFREQRFQADYVKNEHTDEGWCMAMHNSLKSMDYDNRMFVRTTRFLDLGFVYSHFESQTMS
jgi:hypothetical protein